MKLTKLLALVMSLVMMFSLAACGGAADEDTTTTTKPTTTEAPSEADDTADAPEGAPEIKDATGKFTVPEFTFKVNGKEIKNADMADASVYKITVETVNSKGNASEDTYGGYAIKDVLKVAGCEDATKIIAVCSDGYEAEYELTDDNAAYTLVAIEKNKEVGEDGTVFFAPCLETVTGKYAKMVVEIKAE